MKENKTGYENVEDMPADAYVEPATQTDDELLEALLGTPESAEKQVYMKRFKAYFTVKAISTEEYNKLEQRCKYPVKNPRTHQIEEKTDQDKLSRLLVLTACVKPDWNNPKLLSKYNTDDPTKVIRKRLFIGEISQLTEAIMDVSGFDDGMEAIKNSLAEAEKQE
ncbi:phage tail assembly chaperone [Lacrimispora sp.]|uniref:phage tail assembly chaperone n=1 Tax=Lacrimispora sp. TaxID=2719234 RepID=UPI0028AECE94|nr:hypothetical protein [Lacrimispora sp.]